MLFNINLFINLSLSTRATLPTYLTLRNLADAKSLPNLGTKVHLAFMPWLNPDQLSRIVVVGRQPTRTSSIGPTCPLFHTSSTRLSVKRICSSHLIKLYTWGQSLRFPTCTKE